MVSEMKVNYILVFLKIYNNLLCFKKDLYIIRLILLKIRGSELGMKIRIKEKLTLSTGKNGPPPGGSRFAGSSICPKHIKDVLDNISHTDNFGSTSTYRSPIIIKNDNNTKIGLYRFISFISTVQLFKYTQSQTGERGVEEVW